MATIKLYGNLKQYGDKFVIDARTASEALNCLYFQLKGFKQAILNGFFRVRVAKQDLNNQTIFYGFHAELKPTDVIHIIPVVKGAGGGGGLFQVIVGAALITAGIVMGGNPALIGAGIGLMIGGVAQMLTKQPKSDLADHNNASTHFSSIENIIGQGQPVPICYGLMLIGSTVISQGIETY